MNLRQRLFGPLMLVAFALTHCVHDPIPGPFPDLTGLPLPFKPCDPDSVYFQRDVLPIISNNCAKSGCHDAITRSNGLDFTSYASLIASDDDPVKAFYSKFSILPPTHRSSHRMS